MTKNDKTIQPIVHSDVEEALPHTTALATSLDTDDKGHIDHLEKSEAQYEVNSPEEILSRYPLLRDRSEKDLDTLNRRVRRRM